MRLTITIDLDERQEADLREFATAQDKTICAHVATVVDSVLPGHVVSVTAD